MDLYADQPSQANRKMLDPEQHNYYYVTSIEHMTSTTPQAKQGTLS